MSGSTSNSIKNTLIISIPFIAVAIVLVILNLDSHSPGGDQDLMHQCTVQSHVFISTDQQHIAQVCSARTVGSTQKQTLWILSSSTGQVIDRMVLTYGGDNVQVIGQLGDDLWMKTTDRKSGRIKDLYYHSFKDPKRRVFEVAR